MPDRLNQYQRRQWNRQVNRLVVYSLLTTLLLFGIGYLTLNGILNQSAYQEVIASNGALSLQQVQNSRLTSYLWAFVITWAVIFFVSVRIERRKHSRFDFGGNPMVETGEDRGRSIDLYKLSSREFEEAVADLIARQGYQAKVVGGAGDRGVDIKVYNGSGQLVGIVQCKRYKPGKALQPAFVREMATVKQLHGVSIAYLATTTYFTEASKRDAKQLGVRLIDGHDLKHIAKKRYILSKQQHRARSKQINNSPAEPNDPYARFRPPDRGTQYPLNQPLNGMWDDLPDSSSKRG